MLIIVSYNDVSFITMCILSRGVFNIEGYLIMGVSYIEVCLIIRCLG